MKDTFLGLLNLAAWGAILIGAYWILDTTGLGDMLADVLGWLDGDELGPCGTCEPDVQF